MGGGRVHRGTPGARVRRPGAALRRLDPPPSTGHTFPPSQCLGAVSGCPSSLRVPRLGASPPVARSLPSLRASANVQCRRRRRCSRPSPASAGGRVRVGRPPPPAPVSGPAAGPGLFGPASAAAPRGPAAGARIVSPGFGPARQGTAGVGFAPALCTVTKVLPSLYSPSDHRVGDGGRCAPCWTRDVLFGGCSKPLVLLSERFHGRRGPGGPTMTALLAAGKRESLAEPGAPGHQRLVHATYTCGAGG